jgi:2-dehydro-3-deoxy-D-gluconate 5-dehydrogenase
VILERFSLKSKTALVTGSFPGLGAGIAVALAEAGANVAMQGSRTLPEVTQQMLGKMGGVSSL